MFKKLGIFLVSFLIILICRNWFTLPTLSSGDWPYLFLENIKEFPFSPLPRYLWLGIYYQIPTKIAVEYLHMPWSLAERLLWFWPLLILLVFSSWKFTRSAIGVLIFSTNTYILMLIGGGQLGVAMGYALAPLVLFFWNKNDLFHIKKILIIGLIFSLQMMFDPRMAYVTLFAVVVYRVTIAIFFKGKIQFFNLFMPIMIALILNSWWILRMLRVGVPESVYGFDSLGALKYFSFSDFSHSLSLLHPNWPENIFGKTYFLQPEFLILPIFAYCSLLFINQKSDKRIIYFALLGLLGAFLAKGVNEPYGFINSFLFQYIPGMSMFRDPTKFYLLIALSYSVLIPFTVNSFQELFNSKVKKHIISILFIAYFLYLIKPAVLGQLSGTFKSHPVPQEYIMLKDFLHSQPDFFSTFWIPTVGRYGFYSNTHPAISAEEYFKTSSPSADILELSSQDGYVAMQKLSAKYVIVPYDSLQELFIQDRKYNEDMRLGIVAKLKTISWLKQINGFGNIVLFQVLKSD